MTHPLTVDPAAVLPAAAAENFPVALRVLPARYRRHLQAIYAYARLVDDVGDGQLVDDPAERAALLDALEADLRRLWRSPAAKPSLPVIAALEPTVRECGLGPEPFTALLGAGRMDLTTHAYPDWAALDGYCELSANPVGRLVLAVFGVATPARERLSDDVCTGLQILEHCQDVGEDARRGVVYLPQDELVTAGVVGNDLLAETATPALRSVIQTAVGRARRGLGSGRALVASLHGAARVAVAGFVGGGLATADALAAAGYDSLAHQVVPARSRTARHAVTLLLRPTGGGP